MARAVKFALQILAAAVLVYVGVIFLFGLAVDRKPTDPVDLVFYIAVGVAALAMLVAAGGIGRRAVRRFRS
ncbi:MAG: hypothetical protein WA809_03075 [Candidatus Dormiibacterota bacterium]